MTTISNQPYFMPGDVYEKMKTKTKNEVRYSTYFVILWNTLLEMFEYENLPDTIPKRFLESILHAEGEVFVSRINDKLIASHGTLSGEVDEYGLGKECIAVCPGSEARGIRGVDIAYGVNNDTASPDMLVYWISHLLGELSKSEDLNIKYSRLLPIPKVRDEKDKSAFNEIVQKMMDGELSAFASKNILDYELGENSAETFNISDVKDVDKLQYLSRHFDDVLKRFYNFYGQALQTQNKAAQSISDELHGMDSVSFIIPIQMLHCREALCNQINEIFGTEITVKFSKPWLLEYEAFLLRDTNGNDIPDNEEGETDVDDMDLPDESNESNETDTISDETEPEPDPELEEPEEPEEVTDIPSEVLDDSEDETDDREEGDEE